MPSYNKKHHFGLFITLLILIFHHGHTIEPLPLCSICASDDGFSCISCQTCQQYFILSSGTISPITTGYCVCAAGYYINQVDASNVYCDRCHTSCKKCFGPLATNCISCVDRFDFKQDGSVCQAPNNSTDQTLV